MGDCMTGNQMDGLGTPMRTRKRDVTGYGHKNENERAYTYMWNLASWIASDVS